MPYPWAPIVGYMWQKAPYPLYLQSSSCNQQFTPDYQGILLTSTFHFSPDTVTLRNTILEPCTFPLQWTWKVSLLPKLILNLKPLESLHLVLPLQTRPLLIKLLYSIKMIRHLPCAKALRAHDCEAQSFLMSINSPRPHRSLQWPCPLSPQELTASFTSSELNQPIDGDKRKEILFSGHQWQWMKLSWDSPVFVMLPDFTLVTWG